MKLELLHNQIDDTFWIADSKRRSMLPVGLRFNIIGTMLQAGLRRINRFLLPIEIDVGREKWYQQPHFVAFHADSLGMYLASSVEILSRYQQAS